MRLLSSLYLDWFKNILLGTFFEIRHIPYPNSTQKASPRFYSSPLQPPQWSDHHLFFGVNPRKEFRNGKSVSHVVALYTDLDLPPTHAIPIIKAFAPKVSAVISSGNGLHCYWFLQKPLPIDNASDVPLILRGLSQRLSADKVCVSPQQLLRVPGSINPKNGNHCKEIFVEQARRYSLDHFHEFIVAQPHQQALTLNTIHHHQSTSQFFPIRIADSLPEKFLVQLQKNQKLQHLWSPAALPEFQTGSDRDMAVALALAWRNFNRAEIATILTFAPYPKKYERTEPYLHHTIESAKQAIERAKEDRLKS